jgi:ubiquinone/menaquinone biosynthesis C-methylase UbiE
MPFGSIFRTFDYVSLTTADGIDFNFQNNFTSRLGFRLVGIPHISMRLRSRKIRKNVPTAATHMFDAGFGSGVYSFTLADKVKNIIAVDVEKKKIEYAKAVNYFENISFHEMDLTKLTFEDSTFDFIICSEVLEHIKNHSIAFSELARVLRKGGTMLITVPFDSKKNQHEYTKWGHERPGYTENDIKGMCLRNGLTVVKSEGWSSSYAEKAFELNYRMAQKSKVVCGLSFYPLYVFALMSDFIKAKQDKNEIFFKLIKN